MFANAHPSPRRHIRVSILQHRRISRTKYSGLLRCSRNGGERRLVSTERRTPVGAFCLTAHYRQAQTLLRRTKETGRIWDELERTIKGRSLPERVLLALSDATVGYKVRNATYRSAAEITDFVASRDLSQLVREGLLIPDGEKRGRFYVGSKILVDIRKKTREPRPVDDLLFSSAPHLPGLEP